MRVKTWCITLLVFLMTCTAGVLAYGPEDIVVPSEAETIVIGSSGEGRDMMAYRFGSGKNVMVLGFAIHGFEDNWARDGEALVYTAGQLMQKLSENSDLVRNYDWSIYVLPCMNPDGLASGYTNNGPGRCTTTYYDAAGNLVPGGVDLNRSFPHQWKQYTGSRNFNGTAPLSTKESRALAEFIRSVKGYGENVLIDAHGWLSQIIPSGGYDRIYQIFHNAFPGNTYSNLNYGSGYFAAYAADLGYHACLFEFPGYLYSMYQFQLSGYCERYNNCILELLKAYGTYTDPSVTVTVDIVGPGSAQGAGNYQPGSQAVLTAVPEPGARFLGWYRNGELVSQELQITLLVAEDDALTARFSTTVLVTAEASRSGSVSGGGSFVPGEQVTLMVQDGNTVAGWYLPDGTLLSREPDSFSFTARQDVLIYAILEGDVFMDIPAGAWYADAVMEAVQRGLTNGVSSIQFAPQMSYTRAMAVLMLMRLDGAEPGDVSAVPFVDVPGNAYYASAIAWAYENGIVNGVSETEFAPEATVTREDFFTMVIRYLNIKGYHAEPGMLPFVDRDAIHDYAVKPISVALTMGLVQGDELGMLRPQGVLIRSEGTTVILRVAKYMESHQPLPPEESTPEAQPAGQNTESEERMRTIQEKLRTADCSTEIAGDLIQRFAEFVDASDWFYGSCVDVPYQTAWSFTQGEEGNVTLSVRVWDTDTQSLEPVSYYLSTLVYNGTEVLDGLRGYAVMAEAAEDEPTPEPANKP